MEIGDPLQILANPTPEELEAWLTQQVQDEYGTYAHLLRALAWAKLGAHARARGDVDEALTRQPAYEIVELIAALILYVTRDYDRSLALLGAIASKHKYMAAQTLRVVEDRTARLGWLVEQRSAQDQLTALGVRNLRAHIHGLQRASAADQNDPDAAARRLWAVHEHVPHQLGAELDAIVERAPRASTPRVLRGRLHARLGQLDQAEAVLGPASAEARLERWALLLARGRADAVLDAALPSSPSMRAMLLRAEAALACARLELAADLAEQASERAVRASGGVELLRIIIDARATKRGPTPERFASVYALLPGLLSDAARELELTIWADDGVVDDPALLLRCCERAWTMLTPDRGVRLWYRTRAGDGRERLRCNVGADQSPGAHDDDARDLEQAAKLVRRVLEKRGAIPSPRPVPKPALSADAIERFLDDGFVHLRGAFPREVADEIVSEANRRLREEPERWVQGDDPAALAEFLRGYDPEDPETWPEGRVDLLGDRRFAIDEFAPDCDRAIAQLLGGPERVRTRSWANNLIIQFPSKVPLDRVAPQPDWHSWHLDAPAVDTRLDQLQAGLLVFMLFGDLAPRSGNTWLALDSPRKVARALAAAPAGIDFCELDTARGITSQCERFFEVTGEAGDILLVHPLMLHSASNNPSPRIRWLGNPMIYVEGVLEHGRKQPSPVERLIRLALE